MAIKQFGALSKIFIHYTNFLMTLSPANRITMSSEKANAVFTVKITNNKCFRQLSGRFKAKQAINELKSKSNA